jgi:excisionase family DNA binding protein
MIERHLSTGEVSKLCGVCVATVCKWIDSGMLIGHRMPGSKFRRVTRRHLRQFLEKHQVQTCISSLSREDDTLGK